MADPNDQWAAFNPQPAPSAGIPSTRPIITGPAPEPKVTYSPLPKTDPRYRPDYPSAQISSTGQIDFGPQSKQDVQDPRKVITEDMNADHVIRSIKTARSQIGEGYDTGNVFGSKTFQKVPYLGQNSANLSATLSGLQGSVINDTIAQLKALSATGASGYGSLSETEAERLAAATAALQQTQDEASLNRNLDELEQHYRAARAILAGEDPRNPDVAAKYGMKPLGGGVPFTSDQQRQIIEYLPHAKSADDLMQFARRISEGDGSPATIGNAQQVFDYIQQGGNPANLKFAPADPVQMPRQSDGGIEFLGFEGQ